MIRINLNFKNPLLNVVARSAGGGFLCRIENKLYNIMNSYSMTIDFLNPLTKGVAPKGRGDFLTTKA
jgi:hypothetical protein